MSLIINADLCCGHGVCVDVAPNLVEMGDDNKAHVLVEQVDAAFQSQAEAAVAICPQMAIDFLAASSGGATYKEL